MGKYIKKHAKKRNVGRIFSLILIFLGLAILVWSFWGDKKTIDEVVVFTQESTAEPATETQISSEVILRETTELPEEEKEPTFLEKTLI